jgi:hypothetical protein
MDSELTIGSIPMTVQNLKDAQADDLSDLDINEADLLDNLSMGSEAEEKKSEKKASQKSKTVISVDKASLEAEDEADQNEE